MVRASTGAIIIPTRPRSRAALVGTLLAGACVPLPVASGGGRGGGADGATTTALAAVVFSAFADAAARAGCEPLLVGAWRDAALELDAESEPLPLPDSLRRLAAEEVGRAMPRIRELCARSTPRLERLRQIREEIAALPADTPTAPLLFAPVYFARGERTVRDDSVRRRLRALGARLAMRPLPVTVVVEGFADARDEAAGLGRARANAVLAELRRGGVSPRCGSVVARTAPPGEVTSPPMVTFSLDYNEAP